MLCRMLIRRHYARHGEFTALASQPGVEFDLKLQSACALEGVDRLVWVAMSLVQPYRGTFTWGCSKKKIEQAIRTTERVLPHLTDWVLWTRLH